MSNTGRFLTALGRAARRLAGRSRSTTDSRPRADPTYSPGQTGPTATVEIDPFSVQRARVRYAPQRDDEPDPGEVVWTWVPYEERDGRGKDRPVLIIAAEPGGTFLAAQLTSSPHDGHPDYLLIGPGGWDSRGRSSWVDFERIFRVHTGGVRREASALDAEKFDAVAAELGTRYGWR